MSLLQYAKDVCNEIGIEPPATVINNEDDDARRLLTLFNSEGVRLMRRWNWQALTVEKLHTTTADEDQGALSTIASDLDRILPDTTFDRSDRRQRVGESASSWQADKARGTNRMRYRFRLRGGRLLMNPAPGAGETVAFEYISNKWVLAEDGTTTKQAFTADTDTTLLDADILKLGVKWRFQKAVGGDWRADFQEYTEQLRLRFGDDEPQGKISMDDCPSSDVGVVRINK